jgi:hypothetical protein
MWFHCLEYTAFIMNRMSLQSLKDHQTPLFMLPRQRPNSSMIPNYLFWQEVYFQHHRGSPSETTCYITEAHGHFIGFAEFISHLMTYKILVTKRRQIIYRSRLRIVKDGERDARADHLPDPKTHAEPTPATARRLLDSKDLDPPTHQPPTRSQTAADTTMGSIPNLDPNGPEPDLDPDNPTVEHDTPESTPEDDPNTVELVLTSPLDRRIREGGQLETIDPQKLLIGQSFLLPEFENGERQRTFFFKVVEKYKGDLLRAPDHVKFHYTANDEVMDDLISYNTALEYVTASNLIEEPQYQYNNL